MQSVLSVIIDKLFDAAWSRCEGFAWLQRTLRKRRSRFVKDSVHFSAERMLFAVLGRK